MRTLRRLLGLTATGHVLIYDAARLREPTMPGLVEPCQVLTPAGLAVWTRGAIAVVERAARWTGRPLAVVLYAEEERSRER
ncbi:hypothetical protein HNR19_003318 [Nocardioides thalensis]|uniref:Uncharacterized protein n=1 Tax=Nocardioides thalensis TaxID=1914755 RepID=A0A853C377_9ACTN|nr:hypothetical protein [Nocardioides thalensis]